MPVTLYAVSLDCFDAKALAAFWSGALDRPVDEGATAEFAAIGLADPADLRPHWMFHKVAEGKAAKNRFHPDFIAADLETEVKRLVSLGAQTQAEVEESGYRWITLTDPEGNEFDVVAAED
jgi:predicted enzyme related to lactoylglutathione lyase